MDSYITPNDPYMSLREWKEWIQLLIKTHGPDHFLYMDAGHNNVEPRLRTPSEHRRLALAQVTALKRRNRERAAK